MAVTTIWYAEGCTVSTWTTGVGLAGNRFLVRGALFFR
jgi:hypothetical protein